MGGRREERSGSDAWFRKDGRHPGGVRDRPSVTPRNVINSLADAGPFVSLFFAFLPLGLGTRPCANRFGPILAIASLAEGGILARQSA